MPGALGPTSGRAQSRQSEQAAQLLAVADLTQQQGIDRRAIGLVGRMQAASLTNAIVSIKKAGERARCCRIEERAQPRGKATHRIAGALVVVQLQGAGLPGAKNVQAAVNEVHTPVRHLAGPISQGITWPGYYLLP